MRKSIISSLILAGSMTICGQTGKALTLQNRSHGTSPPQTPKPVAGPNRSRGAEARQSVLNKDAVKRLAATSNNQSNATLVLVAVPQTAVTLTPLLGQKEGKAQEFKLSGQNNTLTISKLTPGSYKLTADHSDYKPYSNVVELKKGEVLPLTNLLLPKYGEIVIGGVPAEGELKLDGQAVPRDLLRVSEADGQVMIPRVRAGQHELEISKKGFDSWRSVVNVEAGTANPVTAQLSPARITLTIKSMPGAHVYLNNEDRGQIQADGHLVVKDLSPGSYQMRVNLDGYDSDEKTLTLTLDQRQSISESPLTPIAESDEAKEDFLTGASKWIVPENWRLGQQGLVILGERPGLFRTPGEKRPFNIYRDFQMSFDVRFLNGKGAAWVVRAQDQQNYYLFRLTPGLDRMPAIFSHYVCRDGQCTLKESVRYPDSLNKADDSYFIQLEAKGSQFIHTIKINSNPRRDDPQPLGTFQDSTFSLGGVGFSSTADGETLLQSLYVIPRRRP